LVRNLEVIVNEDVDHESGLDHKHEQGSVENIYLLAELESQLLSVRLKEAAVRDGVDVRGQLQRFERLVRLIFGFFGIAGKDTFIIDCELVLLLTDCLRIMLKLDV
jgi:hypothetical protein